jgi:hypothetical protein
MNVIDSKKKKDTIFITRNWRDHKEQLIIVISFAIFLIIGMIYIYFRENFVPNYFPFIFCVLCLLILYYLFPTSKTIFDLKNNSWSVRKYFYFIPFSGYIGKISDISRIVAFEFIQANEGGNFMSKSVEKLKYHSGFQIWGFENEDGEIGKVTLYSRKIYGDALTHQKETETNRETGLKIIEIFKKYDIPIEFEIKILEDLTTN